MKISCNWLADYLAGSYSPEQLAERITLAGLEVEEIIQTNKPLPGVVIGKVLDVQRHPDADRLTVCRVDIGAEVSQIICGAPNVAVGQTVAIATVGTTLPIKDKEGNPLVLRKAKIRGVESAGMICAEDELGLGDDHSGIMVLDSALPLGESFDKAMGRSSDHVLEVSLTPNRPDATCHLGVARDLSAVFDVDLVDPRTSIVESQSVAGTSYKVVDSHPEMSIEIRNPELCHRYVGVLVDGVTIAPSPQWLQDRLKAIGLRPLNNVVDATNYVLHELGQPLHAFDFDLVAGKKIIVQAFDHEVAFTTLDSQARKVPAGSLFICDGERPVALAGVMGGENSEVTVATKRILIESAWFEPTSIRRTSKTLALQTDASYRFERGIDPAGALSAAMRCAQIIADIAGGNIDGRVLDVHPIKPKKVSVALRHNRLVSVVGVDPGKDAIVRILGRLGFVVSANDTGWDVVVPTWRPDVEREIDLIEEVARIFDYNKIPTPEHVSYVKPAAYPAWELFLQKVRGLAKSMNFREIQTISLLPDPMAVHFVSAEDQVRTLNPISQDQAVLRPDLRFGFLRTAAYNFNRDASGVALFEIGNVFTRAGESTWIKGINEETHLLLGVSGLRQEAAWNEPAAAWTITDLKSRVSTFFTRLGLSDSDINAAVLNDGLSWSINEYTIAQLHIASADLKKAFDLKQDAWTVEINLSKLEPMISALGTKVFQAIPKFPSIEYDAAFIVDASVSALDLEVDIREICGSILQRISVFDVYEGKGVGDDKKSIAYRMTFIDKTKTLTISDVDPIIKNVVKRLEQRHNASLRG
jgi:phenylalanyl-tRNA synthetase beta chain